MTMIETIREQLSDEIIVNELIQYMSSDQLKDFTDHIRRTYDIKVPIDDAEDWYECLSTDEQNTVNEYATEYCNYCAEPHQLNEDDMLACADYYNIICLIEDEFGVTFTQDADINELIKSILIAALADDPTAFYI